MYYYMEGSNRKGPISLEQLKVSAINCDTLVWKKGMSTWQKADSLEELADIFVETPTNALPMQSKVTENIKELPPRKGDDYIKYVTTHPKPNSYLGLGIATTLLCCLPFGIISIIYATKVEKEYYAQRYENSLKNSRLAKRWGIASMVTALVAFLIYLIVFIVFITTQRSGSSQELFDQFII